jgi:lipid-A-disaccharide synthase
VRQLKNLMGGWGKGRGHLRKSPWPPPLKNNCPQILVVAGEASGEGYAARLVAAIKERRPGAQFFGVGGEDMAAQGVRILCPASELAVVGLSEVAGRLPAVLKALKDIARALKRERPSLAILVDFPDFNFWVARLAKLYRVPVMYYISPQVWAWRTYRVRTIARLVDRMAVIFPFEADFYRDRGVPVTYVGHPLAETLPPLPGRRELLAGWGLDPQRLTVALLPGSRAGEIKRHLPTMLAGMALVQQAVPHCQFVLPLASTAPRELVEEMVAGYLGGGPGTLTKNPCPPPKPPTQPGKGLGKGERGRGEGLLAPRPLPLTIIPGQSYAALAAAHLAVVASGTATVEAALAGTPTVIVYRLSPLTFMVGKWLIRVPHVGMANLLAEARLFPELIQDDFTAARLAQEALKLMRDPERLTDLGRGLARVVSRLGGPGASDRAAQVALELMAAR